MNEHILSRDVQDFITVNLTSDVNKIALAKSPFKAITSAELAGQIFAKKKAKNKLPTWFNTNRIYYPPPLSIEQTSSESTALYKSKHILGSSVIDLTAGFGVDSYYFSRKADEVYSCEINPELALINQYNAAILNAKGIQVIAGDGITFLKNTQKNFDTIYLDPARRNLSNKVFKLKDCTPDVTAYLDLFLAKSKRIIIKTAPLLDISAGLAELKNVSEIHIISVKNECKELLWIIEPGFKGRPKLICAALNESEKIFSFNFEELKTKTDISPLPTDGFLYEPDVALLKSGAFNLIAEHFKLKKIQTHSQLYFSDQINREFIGRIFEIKSLLTLNELKKETALKGNVIVRNFPEKAENLVKKYKISPSHDDFIIFTQTLIGTIAIKAKIIQHY